MPHNDMATDWLRRQICTCIVHATSGGSHDVITFENTPKMEKQPPSDSKVSAIWWRNWKAIYTHVACTPVRYISADWRTRSSALDDVFHREGLDERQCNFLFWPRLKRGLPRVWTLIGWIRTARYLKRSSRVWQKAMGPSSTVRRG